MKIEVFDDATHVAQKAATLIAAQARAWIAERGKFTMALSGGRTPWLMLRALASEDLPWADVHIFQVDERVAPADDPDRNLAHLRKSLMEYAPVRPEQIYPMPVETEDLDAAAKQYESTLNKVAGAPAVLDLVHLGLGPDGHTASLVPGDPILSVTDSDVALTAHPYQGRRRMSLTFPMINRAHTILWLIVGADKSAMLPRLLNSDYAIPAGRVRSDNALVMADKSAATLVAK